MSCPVTCDMMRVVSSTYRITYNNIGYLIFINILDMLNNLEVDIVYLILTFKNYHILTFVNMLDTTLPSQELKGENG